MKKLALIVLFVNLISLEVTATVHLVSPPTHYNYHPVWRFAKLLYDSDCTSSFTLENTETNSSYTYNSEKFILMQNSYQTTAGNAEIRMKAGNVIVLKPGTAINLGSVYLARIEPCEPCPIGFSFPKFFTPNGDGFNDTFKVNTANFSLVHIFDRYGKLIKVLQNPSDNWDGRYNSEDVFATDYWFKTDYTDCLGNVKEFKSHFTLKR